ncbi:MAG: aldehyde dehydrogenase [Solimicrobium sp.]|jgi:uncharacterized protein (TIGR02284 family)|nr:aldehyde dehydrogenase [Solimicrobium sp.]
MKHEEIIDTLNNLIEISNDGKEGFIACAENADIGSTELKNLLIERSRGCQSAAEELSKFVLDLAGTPATGTTASGALHRGWLNVKTAIAGKTDQAVLEECERGEDVAKMVYQRALAKDLPESIRTVVEKQYQGLLRNHDMIKKLRDEARQEHT